MKLSIFVLLFASIISVDPALAQVQEIEAQAISRLVHRRSGRYQFNGMGRLYTSTGQSTSITFNADFLDDDVVQKEIELVDNQRADFARVVSKWKKAYVELEETLYGKDGIWPTVEEGRRRWKEVDDNAMAELQKVLLPHQFDALNELQFRCLVKNHGLIRLARIKEVNEILGLSENEIRRMSATIPVLRKEIARQGNEAATESLRIFLEPLSEEEKKAFAKKWSRLFELQNCNIEELMIFLDESRYGWFLKEEDSLEKLANRPVYESGVAANLVPVEPPRYGKPELELFLKFWQVEEFKEWLVLDGPQQQLINDLVQRKQDSIHTLLTLTPPMANSDRPADSEPFEVRKKRVYAAHEQVLAECERDLKKVLGPNGWEGVPCLPTGSTKDALDRCSICWKVICQKS